jgi:dihydroxyacid dehydratase/phosphogluconate dehydratase
MVFIHIKMLGGYIWLLFIIIAVIMYQSSSTPAEDPLKLEECRLAGKYLLELLKMDLKPKDIITEKSLRNAMVIVMALGGSTNAVLHLIAIARWITIFLHVLST